MGKVNLYELIGINDVILQACLKTQTYDPEWLMEYSEENLSHTLKR
jgi:hypothetical protein